MVIKKLHNTGNVLLIILLLGVLLAGGYLLFEDQLASLGGNKQAPVSRDFSDSIDTPPLLDLSPQDEVQQTPSPVRTPRPLPKGQQVYNVGGNFVGPRITEVSIDPVDASPGQTQTYVVKVNDSNPVTSVTIVVTLDNKSNTVNLSLTSGSSTDGTWTGSAPFPDDTLNKNYTIKETAVSLTGTSSTTTTIR